MYPSLQEVSSRSQGTKPYNHLNCGPGVTTSRVIQSTFCHLTLLVAFQHNRFSWTHPPLQNVQIWYKPQIYIWRSVLLWVHFNMKWLKEWLEGSNRFGEIESIENPGFEGWPWISQMAAIGQVSAELDRSTLKGLLGTRGEGARIFEALEILLPLTWSSWNLFEQDKEILLSSTSELGHQYLVNNL